MTSGKGIAGLVQGIACPVALRVFYTHIYLIRVLHTYLSDTSTRWRRLVGSPKLQIIFHKRATKYRSRLQKMTYKDEGSYESSPPCTSHVSCVLKIGMCAKDTRRLGDWAWRAMCRVDARDRCVCKRHAMPWGTFCTQQTHKIAMCAICVQLCVQSCVQKNVCKRHAMTSGLCIACLVQGIACPVQGIACLLHTHDAQDRYVC